MKVRDRNLRRRHEIKLVASGDVHHVFLVRDLTRPSRRRGVDDGRRPDLDHAVLSRVYVEEEVDKCALKGRSPTLVDRKTRARDLRATLEVDHSEPRPDLPVR